jgi:hypothetical protein
MPWTRSSIFMAVYMRLTQHRKAGLMLTTRDGMSVLETVNIVCQCTGFIQHRKGGLPLTARDGMSVLETVHVMYYRARRKKRPVSQLQNWVQSHIHGTMHGFAKLSAMLVWHCANRWHSTRHTLRIAPSMEPAQAVHSQILPTWAWPETSSWRALQCHCSGQLTGVGSH